MLNFYLQEWRDFLFTEMNPERRNTLFTRRIRVFISKRDMTLSLQEGQDSQER